MQVDRLYNQLGNAKLAVEDQEAADQAADQLAGLASLTESVQQQEVRSC